MLAAAMRRVLSEAAWARKNYASTFEAGGPASREALAIRQCITKGAFAELRSACVRQGCPLTGEFLDLEREIDSFSGQWRDTVPQPGVTIRTGMNAGLREQLAEIETKADGIETKATTQSLEAFKAFTTQVRCFDCFGESALGRRRELNPQPLRL
jgi:hypothetical protein